MSKQSSVLPPGVYFGNVTEDGEASGGWIVGRFALAGSLQNTANVEVKVSHHEGYCENGATANRTAWTLSFLVSGECVYFFKDGGGVWVALSLMRKEYVIWAPGVLHHLHVPKRSQMVVVRWPSPVGGWKDKVRGPKPDACSAGMQAARALSSLLRKGHGQQPKVKSGSARSRRR